MRARSNDNLRGVIRRSEREGIRIPKLAGSFTACTTTAKGTVYRESSSLAKKRDLPRQVSITMWGSSGKRMIDGAQSFHREGGEGGGTQWGIKSETNKGMLLVGMAKGKMNVCSRETRGERGLGKGGRGVFICYSQEQVPERGCSYRTGRRREVGRGKGKNV